jgi:iron complex outermembrane receptor protein
MWSLSGDHSLWGAVSRSVRTPSRIEYDADINAGAFLSSPEQGQLLTFVRILGNEQTESEIIYSYESGYRARLGDNIFLDLSMYYNKYEDLINGVPISIPFLEDSLAGPYLVLPYQADNGMDGETYGAEISCGWSVTDWWRLTGGFTWFHFNALNMGDSKDGRQGFEEDENANHLLSLVSYRDLPGNFELNATLYGVDALDGIDIDSYLRFDFNVGWHPTENMTLSAGGRNLFNDSHQEFVHSVDGILASEIPQTFYTKLTMTF